MLYLIAEVGERICRVSLINYEPPKGSSSNTAYHIAASEQAEPVQDTQKACQQVVM